MTPSSGAPVWVGPSVTIGTVSGTQYAFVADTSGNFYRCTLKPDGTFNACGATPSSGAPAWQVETGTLATISGTQYAYVADATGYIYQCGLNSDATLNTCTSVPTSGKPTWLPGDLSIQTIGGSPYAYITDSLRKAVWRCPVNADGTFGSCVKTPTLSAPAWAAYSIAFGSF